MQLLLINIVIRINFKMFTELILFNVTLFCAKFTFYLQLNTYILKTIQSLLIFFLFYRTIQNFLLPTPFISFVWNLLQTLSPIKRRGGISANFKLQGSCSSGLANSSCPYPFPAYLNLMYFQYTLIYLKILFDFLDQLIFIIFQI